MAIDAVRGHCCRQGRRPALRAGCGRQGTGRPLDCVALNLGACGSGLVLDLLVGDRLGDDVFEKFEVVVVGDGAGCWGWTTLPFVRLTVKVEEWQ